MIDPVIADAREAWARIKDRDRAAFEDWLIIGRCLIAARQECMAKAGVNKPYGPAYQKLMRATLDEIGLGDVDSHERVGAIYCVEHQTEIEAWRAGLTDVQRRRANHPNTILAHMRRGSAPQRPGPKPSPKPSLRAYTRPIFWPQEYIKRAADAMREARTPDLHRLARAALEGAIHNEADLLALLDEPKALPTARLKKTPEIAPAMVPA